MTAGATQGNARTTPADITAICMTQAALCRLVPWGTRELGRLPAAVIGRAQAVVRELNEARADEPTASARLWNDVFSEFRPANWRTHPTAPGAFPIDQPFHVEPNRPNSVQG